MYHYDTLTMIDQSSKCRPLLKWAGGKTQLLAEIIPKLPQQYNHYIEPFFGGGALFFAIKPAKGIIADSNPELINLYRTVSDNVDEIIILLSNYKIDKDTYYYMRSLDWTKLAPAEAAARTIFLNKTCFNGLYRVNHEGQFNVPYGKNKNPGILDAENLRSAARLLQHTTIICADYKSVLSAYAEPGDLIFLDPPYLPISEYSDFKRYTKEQFHEEDHETLANEVHRLINSGCYVILTNSNHPLVHRLYKKFNIEVVQTRRFISCNGKSRKGEDVIITAPPVRGFTLGDNKKSLPDQFLKYPSTRFMGSKNKIIAELRAIASQFKYDVFIDLFSGSGAVSYMLKCQGKTVIANDYMAMAATFTKALIENNKILLPRVEVDGLFNKKKGNDHFVEKTFRGLYYSDDDNRLIDILRNNIKVIENPYKKAIAMTALIRACLKKRPRGIFTYTGQRYDDGRKDLQKSFKDHFTDAVAAINAAVFNNGKTNRSRFGDAITFQSTENGLVYIDPPYYSPLSDNEYIRRYHFTEGLARDWEGVEIQEHTITKKFKAYPTPFSSRKGAAEAFDLLFNRFRESTILVSYSSNGLPTMDEIITILSKHKNHVEVVPINYKYSFGNQGHKVGANNNKVQEYIFIGY